MRRIMLVALTVVAALDQGHRAQELQVHGVAVHARQDTAAGPERLLELALDRAAGELQLCGDTCATCLRSSTSW